MRRTSVLAAPLCALALAAAGCGGGGSSAGTTTRATVPTTTTRAVTTTEAPTTTEAVTTVATTAPAPPVIAAAKCRDLLQLGSKLAAATSGGANVDAATLRAEADVLDEAARKAPAEIRDDFRTAAAYVRRVADIVGKIHAGQTPDPGTLAKLRQLQADAGRFAAAWSHITAWLTRNCRS